MMLRSLRLPLLFFLWISFKFIFIVRLCLPHGPILSALLCSDHAKEDYSECAKYDKRHTTRKPKNEIECGQESGSTLMQFFVVGALRKYTPFEVSR